MASPAAALADAAALAAVLEAVLEAAGAGAAALEAGAAGEAALGDAALLFGRLGFGVKGMAERVLLTLAKSLLGNLSPGRFGIWRWSRTPAAGEFLPKPLVPGPDPRDRA